MTYAEIESLDIPAINALLAVQVCGWVRAEVEGSGHQRRAIGREETFGDVCYDCPEWTGKCVWQIVDHLRLIGFRVNIAECAPNVGEVIVVEHSPKHPKQDRVEVTVYYGLNEGMNTCAVALCRAALMAVSTPIRLRK